MGIVAVMTALANAVLCLACNTWADLKALPQVLAMGAGYLAGALVCALAAAKWRRQVPARLPGLAAVLLAALLALMIGAIEAHQAWRLGCRAPDGALIAASAIVWALQAGKWQRRLSCNATACATGRSDLAPAAVPAFALISRCPCLPWPLAGSTFEA